MKTIVALHAKIEALMVKHGWQQDQAGFMSTLVMISMTWFVGVWMLTAALHLSLNHNLCDNLGINHDLICLFFIATSLRINLFLLGGLMAPDLIRRFVFQVRADRLEKLRESLGSVGVARAVMRGETDQNLRAGVLLIISAFIVLLFSKVCLPGISNIDDQQLLFAFSFLGSTLIAGLALFTTPALAFYGLFQLSKFLGRFSQYVHQGNNKRNIRLLQAFSAIPVDERTHLITKAKAAGVNTDNKSFLKAVVADYEARRQAALAEEAKLDQTTAPATGSRRATRI